MSWLKEQLQRLGITYLELEQHTGPLTDGEAHHVARMLAVLTPEHAMDVIEQQGKAWKQSILIRR